jgi:hypothetical protein
MKRMKWQKVDGTRIGDIAQYVRDYVIAHSDFTTDFEVIIGCDSKSLGNNVARYVTVVCIYRIGHGAHVVFARENKVHVYSKVGATPKEREQNMMKNRLWGEVYRAVDVTAYLDEKDIFYMNNIVKFDIHLDLNKKEMYRSNMILEDAMGFVRAQGYDCEVKPDSPAASFAADRMCRGKEAVGAVMYEDVLAEVSAT